MAREGLDRFVEAQRHPTAGFDAALDELRAGGKRGHWIWYVFPQLAGLGSSWNAQHYELQGMDEAAAYLEHPELGPRLLAIAEVVADQLHRGVPIETLMGSRIDALKLVSSLTLFESVARRRAAQDPTGGRCLAIERVAGDVLAAAEAQGYPRCRFTTARMASHCA